MAFFIIRLSRSCGVRTHKLEEISILLSQVVDDGLLANTEGTTQNQSFVFHWGWVERMEVFLGKEIHVVWLVQQDSRQEIIQNLSQLWVL